MDCRNMEKISAAFKQMAYIRQAAEIETAIFKNSVNDV